MLQQFLVSFSVTNRQRGAAILIVRLLHNVNNARSFIVSSGDIEHIAQDWWPKLASFPSLSPFR